jgi:hypothetical protein
VSLGKKLAGKKFQRLPKNKKLLKFQVKFKQILNLKKTVGKSLKISYIHETQEL